MTTNRSMASRHGSLQGPVPTEENSGPEVSGRAGSQEKKERGPQELLNHWMLPASWVPKLAITREAFDTRWAFPRRINHLCLEKRLFWRSFAALG